MSQPDLRRIVSADMTEIDRAVIALHLLAAPGAALNATEVASYLEAAGAPRINRSRLNERLSRDRRTVRDGEGFRVNPRKADEVAVLAGSFVVPVRPPDSHSLVDSGMFDHARGYVRNIVHQINVSYDNACFDCAAVMVRRLFETLLIEAFEHQEAISEITDANGDMFSLSGLIARMGATTSFTVSRQTKQAAPHLKDVGDWSAHNRRHQARRSDVDSAARHLRLACSDLLHLAGQDGDNPRLAAA